ncbi:hypothetical protein GCM10010405_10710 [Streptomyces macrosporus]|uniref:Uncharacterized protein n=1 Tax=Streptomyces macrosporus TaxID=44032 RepID=A0ABN3JGU8_9ACTN
MACAGGGGGHGSGRPERATRRRGEAGCARQELGGRVLPARVCAGRFGTVVGARRPGPARRVGGEWGRGGGFARTREESVNSLPFAGLGLRTPGAGMRARGAASEERAGRYDPPTLPCGSGNRRAGAFRGRRPRARAREARGPRVPARVRDRGPYGRKTARTQPSFLCLNMS